MTTAKRSKNDKCIDLIRVGTGVRPAQNLPGQYSAHGVRERLQHQAEAVVLVRMAAVSRMGAKHLVCLAVHKSVGQI